MLDVEDVDGGSKEKEPVTRLQRQGTPAEAETAPHINVSEERAITPQTLGADGSPTTVFERREENLVILQRHTPWPLI